jgi:hypothetical protein
MHVAAEEGRAEIFSILIAHGADVNATNKVGDRFCDDRMSRIGVLHCGPPYTCTFCVLLAGSKAGAHCCREGPY